MLTVRDARSQEDLAQPDGAKTLKVLTWNVHKCLGTDRVRDPERVLSVIAGIAPDVAVLQEADLRFGRSRTLLDGASIARTTGLVPFGEGTAAAMGWRGNLLLARPGTECLSMKLMALPSLEPRGAVVCRMRAEGTVFDVVGMHLALAGPWRRLQAEAIAAEIEARGRVPTIVAGDSNDWRLRSSALAAIEAALGSSSGRVKSFPSRRPVFALDRIMAGRGAEVLTILAGDAMKASDHSPVVSTVGMARAA